MFLRINQEKLNKLLASCYKVITNKPFFRSCTISFIKVHVLVNAEIIAHLWTNKLSFYIVVNHETRISNACQVIVANDKHVAVQLADY